MKKSCLLGIDASSRIAIVMIAILASLLAAGRAHAQGLAAGAVDTTFGSAQTFNFNANVASMAMQPDGKMVVGGTFTTINGVTRQYVARLNADGTVDTTFAAVTPNGGVTTVAVQSDGKIWISGTFTSISASNGTFNRLRLARLNVDGSVDTLSSTQPEVPTAAAAIAFDADGRILIGGGFATVNGVAQSRIARLNTDGTLDTSFSPAPDALVNAIAVQPDGAILVGGNFTVIGSGTAASRARIARLNADGTADTSFNPGTGANGSVKAIAVQSDGSVLIGGDFTTVNGTARTYVARLSSTGALDSGFAPPSIAGGGVTSVAVSSGGKVVVGGSFTSVGGTSRNRVAQLTSGGALDTGFNPGTGAGAVVNAVAVQSSGKVVVAGGFTTFNGVSRNYMARLNADGSDAEAVYWGTTSAGAQVYAVATQSDGKVLIGGSFTSVNTVTRNRIARLNADGTLDTSFDPGTGPSAFVNAIAIDANGKILIAGNFTSYNGTARSYAARLNGDGTLDTTFAIPGAGLNNQIRAIAVQSDGKIVLGGDFTVFDGSTRNYMARVDATGALDTAFNPAPNNLVRALAIDSSGKILVGGSFTSIAGATRGRITRLNADGTSDSAFAPSSGADSHVYALALQSDGKVVIGGDFLNCNGATRTRIARLTSAGANDTGFSPAANSTVNALQTVAGGKVIAGGSFQTIAGVSRNRIARLNSDGSIDTGFDVGTGANGNVLALAMDYNGRLLMGGAFNSVNSLGRMSIARIGNGAFTVTLSGRTLDGGASVVIPSLRGTLTGASIDLTTVSGDSYSSDLTVVVTPTSTAPDGGTPKTGLAQVGGFRGDFVLNANAATRLYWGTQSAVETIVPLRAGPVSFTSSFDLTTNSAYRVWITNGYTAGSSTFTATITLQGVTGAAFYPDADGDGYGNSSGTPVYATSGTTSGTGDITFTGVPAGYVANDTDCNDSNAAINPGATEVCDASNVDEDCDGGADDADPQGDASGRLTYYRDQDGDTYSISTTALFCDTPSGYILTLSSPADCNDTNAAVNPSAAEICDGLDNDCNSVVDDGMTMLSYYTDADGDGYGATTASAQSSCTPVSGKVTNNTDCNDGAAGVNPGATEVCDSLNTDEDCDSLADNADPSASVATKTTFYVDADGDTHTTSATGAFCDLPSGYRAALSSPVDCNDASAAVYPGATENCANLGVDNDCDSVNDDAEAVDSVNYYTDADTDNYGASTATAQKSCSAVSGKVTSNTDCNDGSAAINPGATEVCDSLNTDEDCDSLADNADPSASAATKTAFYRDQDNDTYSINTTALFCDLPSGYSVSLSSPVDCNDASASVYPGAAETCANDGTDNDCDGEANADSEASDSVAYYVDGDSDGYGAGSSTMSCTAITGSVTNSTDCDDSRSGVNPAAQEVCDAANRDEDCDSLADDNDPSATGKSSFYADADHDSYTGSSTAQFCDMPSWYEAANDGDCNDASASVYPGAAETCANDGTDNDCDGEANADSEASDSVAYYLDADGDGYGAGSSTMSCTTITGSVTNSTDCDDSRSGVNPAAQEVCDAVNRDEDCDSLADDNDPSATGKSSFYADADHDSYTGSSTAQFCDMPSWYEAANDGDCNDASASVYPGAAETCANDGTDNDCDGEANADSEATDSVTFYVDADNDGHSIASSARFCTAPANGYQASLSSPIDCNDAIAAIHPGAAETCANDGTDNDCDGEANADSEAIDSLTYYRDADGDGAGDPLTTVQSCSAVTGYLTVAGDTCPSDPLKLAPGQCGCGTLDTDSDGDGTANCNDLCPNDPSKVAPGACGCGIADVDADSSGTADCREANPAVSMAVADTEYQPGDTVSVRIATTATGLRATSVQLSVHFDPTRLLLSSTSTVAGSAFTASTLETIDNTNGTLKLTLSAPSGSIGSAQLATLDFVVLEAPATCSESGIVAFGSIGAYVTRFATDIGVDVTPSTSGLAAIRLDGDGPVLAGVPSGSSIATDAGSTYGAYVAAPTVTASDTCDGTRAVAVLVTYPDGSTGSAWPTGGMFPIGTTTVRWDTDDALGNTSTETRTVAVANHQLLDLSMTLFGGMSGASTRSIRVKAGSSTQIVPVTFAVAGAVGSGTATGVQVPVAAGYSCVSVKDTVHSITKTAVPTISGARYSASMLLRQGDSNDDDIVDIVDFGLFLADRGTGKAPEARSNFNSDAHVGTGDFSFLTLSFFRAGESCTGALDGVRPRTRVSVKDLRRAGLGDAAAGDVNHDGWVDMRDVQSVLQGIDAAQAEQESGGAPPRW